MNGNKPQRSLISTGTTSIVLIFVMLCLLTFSVLSLVSAQANLRLSRKSAERTADYYAAENAANDVLIELIGILGEARDAAADESSFYAAVQAAAARLDVTFSDDTTVSYRVPLGEEQALAVTLTLHYTPDAAGQYYTVTGWQTVSEYDWQTNAGPQLYDPGAPLF